MSDLNNLYEKLLNVVEDVKETEATNTRNASTDYYCRALIRDHGDAILAIVRNAKEEEKMAAIRGGLGT